jgi:Wzt C-terminal domain
VKEPVTDPIVFLDFFSETGVHLAGPNSWLGGLRLGEVTGPGVVELRLATLPFLPGVYSISAAVASGTLETVYDRTPHTYRLRVRSTGKYEPSGVFTIDGEWTSHAEVAEKPA